MNRARVGLVALVASVAACVSPPDTTAPTFDDAIFQEAYQNQIIVHLDPGATSTPQEVLARHGIDAFVVYDTPSYRGFAAVLNDATLDALRADPDVSLIGPDHKRELFEFQRSGDPNEPAAIPWGIARTETTINPIATAGGNVDVDVAVIDSGVGHPNSGSPYYRGHPDLNVYATGSENFVNSLYNCHGAVCKVGPPVADAYYDVDGHGTHVSGTIGAIDNSIGVVGVAPGARIWALRVFGDPNALEVSGGTDSIISAALAHVENHASEIEVVNMSLGGCCNQACTAACDDGIACADVDMISDPFKVAICNVINAGVTVVVAAGNDAANAANFAPAAYDDVITVSAFSDFDGLPGGLVGNVEYVAGTQYPPLFYVNGDTNLEEYCRQDQDDSFADFSNWGPDVDIMAPGVCTYSTWHGLPDEAERQFIDPAIEPPPELPPYWYHTISGTSMASPHVAGAAALYRVQHPGASPFEVRDALVSWAKWNPTEPGFNCAGTSTCSGGDPSPHPLMFTGLRDQPFDNMATGTTTAFDPIPPSGATFTPNTPDSAAQIADKVELSMQPLTGHNGDGRTLSLGYVDDANTSNENAVAQLCLPDTAMNHFQASFSIWADNWVDFNLVAVTGDDPDGPLLYHYLVNSSGQFRENTTVGAPVSTGSWHTVVVDINRSADKATLTLDGVSTTSLLSVGWPNTLTTAPMKCLRIMSWLDTSQQMWIDNVTVLSWDN